MEGWCVGCGFKAAVSDRQCDWMQLWLLWKSFNKKQERGGFAVPCFLTKFPEGHSDFKDFKIFMHFVLLICLSIHSVLKCKLLQSSQFPCGGLGTARCRSRWIVFFCFFSLSRKKRKNHHGLHTTLRPQIHADYFALKGPICNWKKDWALG